MSQTGLITCGSKFILTHNRGGFTVMVENVTRTCFMNVGGERN